MLLQIQYLLRSKSFLNLLLIINFLGTIYGYYWYGWQLAVTEPQFLIFVPDSPTASLFFTIAILGWLFGKNFKLIEALALITLIKYGIWAVVMNLWTIVESGPIGPLGWMLVVSHFLMAVQAVLYIFNYRFTYVHVLIAAIWTLHNDVIDYVYGQMPTYRSLEQYASHIGYFTFWLSICCIGIAFIVQNKGEHLQNK
ncbi:putative membrane protein YpjA [Lysinibacillus composti]|nr:putative membrane protein YpjA [Lysinibacillus composti]